MGKYFIRICLVCLIVSFSSCRKTAKELVLSKSDNAIKTIRPQLVDGVLGDYAKTLDESFIKKLSEHLDNNKALADLLSKNKDILKTWKILSNSNYGKDVEIIKYFDALP